MLRIPIPFGIVWCLLLTFGPYVIESFVYYPAVKRENISLVKFLDPRAFALSRIRKQGGEELLSSCEIRFKCATVRELGINIVQGFLHFQRELFRNKVKNFSQMSPISYFSKKKSS